MKSPKDNWIKAFDEQFGFEKEAINMHVSHQYTEMIKTFISQVEKDAIEKRTKLLEDSFKHRTKPVVNLDDENKNCKICGYDHEYMTEANENAYKVAHLKVELSQAIEKTNKRWREKLEEYIDKLDKWTPPSQFGSASGSMTKKFIKDDLSDLLEDK